LTFETTTLYLPQDFTPHDLEFVDRKDKSGSLVGEHIDKNAQKDEMKANENPYWFEFDGAAMVRDTPQQLHYNPENAHHHHHQHNTRRAKRNHNRKLKAAAAASHSHHNVERRSIDYQDDEGINTETFSSSEVIGNIFNENDTVRDPLKQSGKYDGELILFWCGN
jgi:BRCT domain type II-containing protein